MGEGQVQRKLAAILAADVVGYSRLMGIDEEDTLAALKACRGIIDPLIEMHRGRIFGGAGDSLIAEFAGPVDAVRCATEIQLAIDEHGADLPDSRRMRFRIGINLGDVIIDDDDLKGEGVNVAARLEALAPPGGVCVSESVLAQVRDHLGLDFLDLGEHRVKNIARPIRVYRVPLASEERVLSPYRGLDLFEFEHADLFFGRTAAIAATRERLERQAESGTAFLLIYGMSGAGKSSLLRAGLLPALVNSGESQGAQVRRYCLFKPSEGSSPAAALLNSLQSQSALPEWAADRDVGKDVASLDAAPDDVVPIVRSGLAAAAESQNANPQMARLIVAVDQMEELFTSRTIDPPAAAIFIEILSALARSGQVWVVGTIRADFYHRCGEIPEFSELKDGLGSFELLPPTGPEIAQMIREPARAAGMNFETAPDAGDLADVIQQAATRNPGSLPLLEFVLDALYEAGKDRRQMTFEAYRALGGLDGAVARRADDVAVNLPKDVQATLPAVISALTTVRDQDGKTTSWPAPMDEVASNPQHAALVEALIEARLLVSTEGPDARPMIRLAHEALLSSWPRARDIVTENQEFLATRSRVGTDARRWIAENRPPDLLLPAGKRLAEAEDILLNRAQELNHDIITYTEASLQARDEQVQAEREAEAKQARLEIEGVRKLAQRTRIAAIVTLILAIVAGAGALFGIKGQSEAERQAVAALSARDRAESAEEEARHQAADAIVAKENAQVSEKQALLARNQALRNQSLFLATLAKEQTEAGDPKQAIQLALEALRGGETDRPHVAEAETALRNALAAFRQRQVLRHDDGVAYAEFNFDGSRIVSASFDGTARIWDSQTGELVNILRGHTDELEQAQFSPDGKQVITSSHDGTVRIWDARTGRTTRTFNLRSSVRFASFGPHGNRMLAGTENGTLEIWDLKQQHQNARIPGGYFDNFGEAVFSPDGRFVAKSDGAGSVKIWDAATGNQVSRIPGGTLGMVNSISFSPDASRLLIVGNTLNAILWDIREHREVAMLTGHKSNIRAGVFSPNGQLAVTTSIEGAARVWNADSGKLIVELGEESSRDLSVATRSDLSGAISPNGTYLATPSYDGIVRVFDLNDAYRLTLLQGHRDTIEHVAFSPDGASLLSASHDGTVRIWDIDGLLMSKLTGHTRRPTFAAFSPDGTYVATAANDSTARIWETATGRRVALLEGHQGPVTHLEIHPDGQRIATASQDGIVRLWDIGSAGGPKVLNGHGGTVKYVSFNQDGTSLLSASADGSTRLWDVETGGQIAVLEGHEKQVNLARFGPGDRVILTASDDGTARLWDAAGLAEGGILAGHTGRIYSGSFSSNGRLVVTASHDRTARVWDAAKRQLALELKGHQSPVIAAVFSPDDHFIATASRDHTARIWDAADGAEVAVLRHGGPVTHVAFSPDGRIVATTSRDGTARLWRPQSGIELANLAKLDEAFRYVAFSADGKFAATVSDDKIGRIFHIFPATDDLFEFAKELVPERLTACQRIQFFMALESDYSDCSDPR